MTPGCAPTSVAGERAAVAPLLALEADADAARQRRLVEIGARRIDAEPIGRQIGHQALNQLASALTRLVRREILREAALAWTMPFCAARASSGSADFNAS